MPEPVHPTPTSAPAPAATTAARSGRFDALLRRAVLQLGLPSLAIAIFLGLWSAAASRIEVSFGALPGPRAVFAEVQHLWQDHREERARERAFYARQAERKAAFLERHPDGTWTERRYAGRPTFIDQIFTSLKTVFTGFVIASLIAVPLGVLCGLSRPINLALNPFIQLFKPVSPLAWLPIVMILVSALYNPTNPLFEKAFLSSAITVALCSLWPTLINTAVGVAGIDPDYLNVARVLRLSWWARIRRIVLPAALPLIFTGLRLSLGVGWMVLIAAEMLAQNPGLGKFVWDMFQNGSSQTLARIMVAVFAIGLIGFALDRLMLSLQRAVSFGGATAR
jgi:nitrate/nitrite transport system permease protein